MKTRKNAATDAVAEATAALRSAMTQAENALARAKQIDAPIPGQAAADTRQVEKRARKFSLDPATRAARRLADRLDDAAEVVGKTAAQVAAVRQPSKLNLLKFSRKASCRKLMAVKMGDSRQSTPPNH